MNRITAQGPREQDHYTETSCTGSLHRDLVNWITTQGPREQDHYTRTSYTSSLHRGLVYTVSLHKLLVSVQGSDAFTDVRRVDQTPLIHSDRLPTCLYTLTPDTLTDGRSVVFVHVGRGDREVASTPAAADAAQQEHQQHQPA